ncbi:MAG: hypothetical protein IPL79_17740 [Myxococcales bacterium]|nr:hypothetical protein [Myxococcales bacterium]
MLAWCFIGMAVSVVASGCGDNAPPIIETDPPPPPPEPGPCDGELTLEQFADCFNGAYIDKIFNCGLGDPGAVDEDNLTGAWLGSGYDDQSVADILASIAAGRVAIDGAAAQACYAQMAELDCVYLFVGGNQDVLSECDNVLVPQVASGDTCGADFECDDGDCLGLKDWWDIGTVCEPTGECVGASAIGESCNDNYCTDGSHCEDFDNNDNYTCESGDAGADCESNDSCDSGLYCVFPAPLTGNPVLGTCTAKELVADGDPCSDTTICDDGGLCLPAGDGGADICVNSDEAGDPCIVTCNNGLSCVTTFVNLQLTSGIGQLGECTSEIPGVGDDCLENANIGYWGACGLFLQCEGQTKGDPGTCRNIGTVGAPCGGFDFAVTGGGGECTIGLFCSDEVVGAPQPTCIAPQAEGSFCTDSYQCADGVCNSSGLCVTAVACEPEFND